MGWERTKALTSELSPPPSLMWWLLAGATMMIVGVLLFILHASVMVKTLSEFNIWWISLTPLGIWLFLFCLRGWLWGREVDEHAFLQKEADLGQKQWEVWAERHLAILGSGILLPDGVTADAILGATGDSLPSRGTLTRRISDTSTPVKYCLSGVQKALQDLPQDLPLSVTIVTDLPTACLVETFSTVWSTLFSERRIPNDITVTDTLSLNHVEERLKQSVLTVDLILVMQLCGNETYSDGLAALLLTSDDVVQKYHLPHLARLLRPMPLDMTAFEQDISLFLATQTAASGTARVLGDALLWETFSAPLMTVGAAHGTVWQPAERGMLEKWCGVPGPLAPWILTALAVELVSLRKESLLTLFSSGEEHFISTVTSGSEDEQIR